jgi:hypothetical protein
LFWPKFVQAKIRRKQRNRKVPGNREGPQAGTHTNGGPQKTIAAV